MRLVTFALLLVPVLAPATALAGDPAPPTFEILDRGTAVEVIAHNVTAAKTAITPIRSRLEIPLVGHPRADKALPTDATVKVVEFDGIEPRVLSVKLGFERPEVKALAKYAQAIQVGSDVHIMFPRVLPAAGAAIVLPEPTLPAELAAKVAAAGQIVPIALVPTPAPTEAKPEIKSELKSDPKATDAKADPKVDAALVARADPKSDAKPASKDAKPEQTPSAATTASSSTAQPATATAPKEDAWQKLSLYAAVGLAAIGCGAWLLRRRKAALGPVSSIDVIAQKSLGSKAKVVWFTAGGREMVVAVTAQQVRMLGQWKKPAETTGGPIALPSAHTHAEGSRELRTERAPSSPAVGGILKLRERRTQQNLPQVSEDIATDDVDADALWAKEILAATGARR